jgi:hypothetical protein
MTPETSKSSSASENGCEKPSEPTAPAKKPNLIDWQNPQEGKAYKRRKQQELRAKKANKEWKPFKPLVDWTDPDQRRAYYRQKATERRLRVGRKPRPRKYASEDEWKAARRKRNNEYSRTRVKKRKPRVSKDDGESPCPS